MTVDPRAGVVLSVLGSGITLGFWTLAPLTGTIGSFRFPTDFYRIAVIWRLFAVVYSVLVILFAILQSSEPQHHRVWGGLILLLSVGMGFLMSPVVSLGVWLALVGPLIGAVGGLLIFVGRLGRLPAVAGT